MSASSPAVDEALAARLARDPPRRIAVIQTAFLGDTVFSSALIAGLAARFPQAGITMVVTPRGRDVARASPGVDDVLVYDKRGADAGLAGFFRSVDRLRERKSELAILPHRSLRSALLAFRAKIPERIGFAGAAGRWLYTATARDPSGPFIAREAALLQILGAHPGPMRLVPTAEDRAAAAARLNGAHHLIAFGLGSEWQTKIWPDEHAAELASRLAARGFTPLLLGGPREKTIAQSVLRVCPSAIDTTGNPVGEALGLLTHAQLCIGGDSGLAHAARALSIPTLLLFGPTDPKLHQLGSRERALSLHLDCSPCSPHGGVVCPLGHHRCLRDLSVDEVEMAALQLLGIQAQAEGVR